MLCVLARTAANPPGRNGFLNAARQGILTPYTAIRDGRAVASRLQIVVQCNRLPDHIRLIALLLGIAAVY
jgi:hypothetical protein